MTDKKFGLEYIANPKKKVDPLTIKLLIDNPQNQYNLVCNVLMEVCGVSIKTVKNCVFRDFRFFTIFSDFFVIFAISQFLYFSRIVSIFHELLVFFTISVIFKISLFFPRFFSRYLFFAIFVFSRFRVFC